MPGTAWTLVRDQHKPTRSAPTGGVARTVTGRGGGRGAGLPGGAGPGAPQALGEGFKLRKPLGQPLTASVATSLITAKKQRPPKCLHVREARKGFMLQPIH